MLVALVALPLVLVLAAAAVVSFLPWIVTGERLRREAVSALTEALGTCASVDRVEYHPFTGVELRGVRICPPAGFDRDLLTAARIAIHYDLSEITSRSVRVREVAIEAPRVVVETKGGRRNLDAILEHLAAGKPTPEPKKASNEPMRGPLSPIKLVLERAVLDDVALELAGEGPHAQVSGLSVAADASIDPARLRAGLRVRFAPKTPGAKNVTAEVPAADGQPAVSTAMSVELTTSASVAADVHDGLALELAALEARLRLGADVERGATKIPHTELGVGLGLRVEPGHDRAALSRFTADLDGRSIADANVEIDGLARLLDGVMGRAAALALAGDLGIHRGSGEGTVHASVRTLELPLDLVAPHAAVFRPTLRLGGRVALAPIELEGTAAEITEGLPRRFSLALSLDRVHAADTSLPFALRALDGQIRGARTDDERAPFALSGAVALRGLSQANNTIGGVDVTLDAAAERLAWPLPGHLRAGLGVAVSDVAAPGVRVRTAKLDAAIEGTEVFAVERTQADPIAVTVKLGADGVHTGTGTTATDVGGVSASLGVALDRVLTPALRPIAAKLELGVARVSAPAAKVEGVKLAADATVNDPRTGAPLDVGSDVRVSIARVAVPSAELEGMTVHLGSKLDAVAPRTMADAPRRAQPAMLPAQASASLEVVLPKIVAEHPAVGRWETSARLSASGRADLVRGTARADSVAFELANVVRARASGDVSHFLLDTRDLAGKLEVEPIDLPRLFAVLPAAVLRRVPALPSSGTVGLSVSARGRAPAPGQPLDLAAPPMDVQAALRFAGIDLAMPASGVDVRDLGGVVLADLRKGRAAIQTTVRAEHLEGGPKDRVEPAEGLVLTSTASLRGDVWGLVAEGSARRGGPRISVDVAYPKHGDLDIRRFDLAYAPAGLDLSVSGGLSRRRFGVLRPALTLRAALDLDKLRAFVPEVGDAHGGASFALDVDTKADTLLDVRGRVEVDHLSYTKPGLEVHDATGRIPIEQRLVLPEPVLAELASGAEGTLGDDLEVQIGELTKALAPRILVVDDADILVEAPRAADYSPLRPYRSDKGAKLTIERLVYAGTPLEDVTLEALWRSGVLRVDRFAAHLWEGDVLADMAVQVSSDQNARMRVRATITDLNSDIPYAAAKNLPPVREPSKKEDYRISGTFDMKFALKERSLNATLDLTKLKKPTVERFIGAMDPKGANEGIQRSLFALDISEDMGLRPTSGKVWISQNLLGLNLEWQRLPVHPKFRSPGEYFSSVVAPLGFFKDVGFFFARPVLMVTVGSFIVNTVNGALDKFSVGNFIDAILDKVRAEDQLAANLAKYDLRLAAESKLAASASAAAP